MEIQKNINIALGSIIKRKVFNFDIISGYYYINNYADNSFLFEYHPKTLICIMSFTVKDYLLYRGFTEDNMKDFLLTELCNIFNLDFKYFSFYNESPLNLIKCNLLSETIRVLPHTKRLNIPVGYFNFEKIELVRYGATVKLITKDFYNTDISNMTDGSYLVFIYVKGIFKGRNIGTIRIKNGQYEHII